MVKHRTELGSTFIRGEIKKICDDELLRKILGEYPIWKLPFKYFLVAVLMRLRLVHLIYFILRW
jgi:hypothetical protein